MAFVIASLYAPPGILGSLRVEDLILVVLAFLLLSVRSSQPGRTVERSVYMLVLVLGVCGAIARFVVVPPLGFGAVRDSTTKEVGRLLKLMVLAFVVFRVPVVLRTAGHRAWLARFVLGALIAHAALGVGQYFDLPVVMDFTRSYFNNENQFGNLGREVVEAGQFRACGTVYDSNIYGQVAVLLGFLVGMLNWRLALWAVVVTGLSVLLSASRTALGVFLILGLAAIVRARQRFATVLVLAAAAIAVVFVRPDVLLIGESLGGRLASSDLLTSRPQYTWLPQMVMQSSAALGFGVGVYSVDSPMDSDYILALVQYGLIGLTSVALFYAIVLRRAARVSVWTLGSVASAALIGVTNGVLFGNEIAPFALLSMGFGIAAGSEGTARTWPGRALDDRRIDGV